MTDLLVELVKNGSEAQLTHLLGTRPEVRKDVNRLSAAEESPLHVATWRNSAAMVQAILRAGGNPDVQDGESGWTALHKALYWGQLHVAGLMLAAGASLEGKEVTDHQGRTPLDLVTRELGRYCQQPHAVAASAARAGSGPDAPCKHAAQVFSWGSGANYQLGTGSTDFADAPVRVEAFGWEDSAASSSNTGATSSTTNTNSAASGTPSGSAAGPANPSRSTINSTAAVAGSTSSTGGGGTSLGGSPVVALAAAKFHSAAVTADGRLWTWGWGRGGRLGHPAFNIHSGEAALIRPWAVAGLGKRQVVSVAAGKHHMLVATSAGEAWSWGSNRDGRLGYGGVDTQPTPCKVATFTRSTRIVAVAAANKHSVALSAAGEVFTWGANGHGQCGYGTTGGAANPTPRLVDALKGRAMRAISAAKRHTTAVSVDGEVWVWGHRVVTPRRLPLAGCRDTARLGPAHATAATATGSSGAVGGAAGTVLGGSSQSGADVVGDSQLVFHRGHAEVTRPHAVSVAAGYSETTVLTRDGALLVWRSGDPSLRLTEVNGPLAGVRVVSVSAGKTRTAAVTADGDVYVWEAVRAPHAGGGAPRAARVSDSGAPALSSSYAGGAEGPSSFGAGSVGAGVLGSSYGASGAAAAGGLALAGMALEGQRGGGGGSGSGAVMPQRVSGLKRAAAVAVGEKHTLALSVWTMPPLPDEHGTFPAAVTALPDGARRGRRSSRGSGSVSGDSDADSEDDGLDLDGAESPSPVRGARGAHSTHHHHPHSHHFRYEVPPPLGFGSPAAAQPTDMSPPTQPPEAQPTSSWVLPPLTEPSKLPQFSFGGDQAAAGVAAGRVPSLQVLAQRAVALQLVEPRSVLQILEYADVAGASLLRAFCVAVALRNLDAVLLEAPGALLALPPHLVKELEQHYKAWLQPPQPTRGPAGTRPAAPLTTGGINPHGVAEEGGVAGGSGTHTPALGSSPVSGSWVERAAEQYLRARPTGGSEGGGGESGSAAGGAGIAGRGGRRRHWLSKLQLPRRPTSVPPWLDGSAAGEGLLPAVSARLLAQVSDAALTAIGHTPHAATTVVGGSPVRPGTTPSGAAGTSRDQQPRFLPHSSVGAAADAAAAAERLARNVARKLQQVGALEARAREGGELDAQQLAKLGQKAPLLEALHMLEAGAPVDAVQGMLSHAQHVAGKLAAGEASSTTVPPTTGAAAGEAGAVAAGHNGKASEGTSAGGAGAKGREPQAAAATGVPSATQAAAVAAVAQKEDQGVQLAAAPPTVQQAGAGRGSGVHMASSTSQPSAGNTSNQPGSASTPGDKSKDRGGARKGDLSAFLSGALDKRARPPPVPGTDNKPKGPAWGGAAMLQAATIQPLMMPGSGAGTAGPAVMGPPGIGAAAGVVSGSNPSPLSIAAAAGGAGAATAGPAPVPLSLRELLGPQLVAGSISAAAGGRGAGVGATSSGAGGSSGAQGAGGSSSGSVGGSAWVTPQPKSRALRDAPGTPLFTTPAPAPPFPAPSPYSASSQHTLIFAPDFATPAPPTPPTPSAPTVRTLSLADFMATPKPIKPVKQQEGPAWGGAVPGSSPVAPGRIAGGVVAGAGVAGKQRTLREIQAEQEAARAAAPIWRGGTGGPAAGAAAGAGVSGAGAGAALQGQFAKEGQQGAGGQAQAAKAGDTSAGGSVQQAVNKGGHGRNKAGGKGVAMTLPLGLNVGAAGGAGAAVAGSSPPVSKWYVPEQLRPQPLPAIQTEERAITEIAALYKGKGVVVSRSGSKPPQAQ